MPSMRGKRYASALATVLRGSAVPYGYTLTVWTSGMMVTRQRGIPSVGEVFLFAAGAVAAFAVLGIIVRLMRGVPFEPPHGALRRTGMVHFLAVGAALGAATLVALIHSGVAWPLGAFVATGTYLALATLELTLAEPGSEPIGRSWR
jgi:hypothetical protein